MNPRAMSWMLAACVLIFPFLVYSDTVGARFGLRDDYSLLREAHDPGDVVFRFTASQGRPVYGWLLQESFSRIEGIDGLRWSRMLSALCIGLLGAGTALCLDRRLGWPRSTAYPLGAVITILPTAQIVIGWGSCWPHVVAALFAVAAFALAEPTSVDDGLGRRPLRLAGAIALLTLGTLTYQSNALFYIVLLAAGLRRRSGWPCRATLRWLAEHLLLVGGALLLAYAATRVMFALGLFPMSPRFGFESDWLAKAVWFVRGPLVEALALVVINDVQNRTEPWHTIAASLTGLVILAGFAWAWVRRDRNAGVVLAVAFAILPPAAFCVSLLAVERWSAYRTLYALTGVLLVFFLGALERLANERQALRQRLVPGVLALLLVGGGLLARDQAYDLIVEPQMRELQLLEAGARAIDPARRPSVYVITPRPEDTVAPLRHADEFGSLSTDSDWTPREMLKLIMQERFPTIADIASRYRYASGRTAPAPGRYDVVIDLRRLREFRPRMARP